MGNVTTTVTQKLKQLTEKASKAAIPIVKKEALKSIGTDVNKIFGTIVKISGVALFTYVAFGGVHKNVGTAVAKAIPPEEALKAVHVTYNDVRMTINYLLKGEN